jgi:hypothetical protein
MSKLGSAVILILFVSSVLFAQTPAAPIKRTADGKPDFSGIWQGGGISSQGNTANIVPTGAPAGGAPAAGAPAGGARGARGGGGAPAAGGRGGGAQAPAGPNAALPTAAPMQPWAAEKSRGMKNIDDPTVHCMMPGVPRVVGMPFPLEIIQTPNKIVIVYEAFRTVRIIPTDGKLVGGESAPSFNGDSVGHWEGDTLVVDVKNFNGRIWGPGQMRVTSDKYHVVERYNLQGDTLAYEAMIEDPGVLTGPFVYRATLRRPPETRIMEYECIENNINLNSIVQ